MNCMNSLQFEKNLPKTRIRPYCPDVIEHSQNVEPNDSDSNTQTVVDQIDGKTFIRWNDWVFWREPIGGTMHHFCPAHEWDFRKPSLVYFEHLDGYVHILRLAIADLEELFSRRGFEAIANLSGMNQTAVQVIQSLKQKPALEQISVEGTSAFTWWALRTTEEFCLNTFSHRFKLYVSDLLSLSKDTGTSALHVLLGTPALSQNPGNPGL